MRLQFDPPFLPLQTAALAALTLGLAFTLYLRWELRKRAGRHVGLLLLRSLVALLLAFILLNPVARRAEPARAVKSPFLLLLDTSRSMETPDGGAERETRWQAAKRFVLEDRALLDALSLRYELRVYGFDSRATARTLEALRQVTRPPGERTGIGDALAQAVNGARPAGMPAAGDAPARGGALLVSDGRDNGGGFPLDAARASKALGFPVYTLCIGKETKGRDLLLLARRPQVFASPGQTVELAAEIRNTGIGSVPVQVELLREGRKVAAQTVTTAPGTREVAFPVTETGKGFTRYTLACSVVRGETNSGNNRANVFLNVLDTRARVLLLEGSPSWDSKFLAQTLRSDPTITLDSIYQLTNTRPFAFSGSPDRPELRVPRTLQDFAHYDVVMLGKGFESFFDAAGTEALKRWVSEKGGHIVFLRGRSDEGAAGLRELEPVDYDEKELDQTRVRLTEAGRTHPGFAFSLNEDSQTVVQKLPNLISASRVRGEKALAVVLARAQDEKATDANAPEMALLAYQRYGQGKTVAIVGQGLWRWAFLPPELESYGRVYTEFWTQMVRWLVSDSDFLPGQNISLRTDRTSYANKETVTLLGFLRGAKPAALPQITLTTPDEKTVKLVPASGSGGGADFTATFRPIRPGEYIATVPPPAGREKSAPATAAFTVYPGQAEDENRSADPALMRQMAAAGGGQALTPADLKTLPEKLRAAELASTRTDEARTAWDRGWVLALLVGLLTTEWLLRRRIGLA